MNTENHSKLINDCIAISKIISHKKLDVANSESNADKWLSFQSDFTLFQVSFKMIFRDDTIFSTVTGKSSDVSVNQELSKSAYTRFLTALHLHDYDSIKFLANDPQFAQMLQDGQDNNYANIMLLISDFLQLILDSLNDTLRIIDSLSSNQINNNFLSLTKKGKYLLTMINGDNYNKNIMIRYGAHYFLYGTQRPLDPPFVRLVRFFKQKLVNT